jgi:Secretion system C-terminal sorting domain
MKTLLFVLFCLTSTFLFGQINTMTFNGTSTIEAGVEFTFSTGGFENGNDGTMMSLYDNHPYANIINGGQDHKDITISQPIKITSVNVSFAVNIEFFKLQFLNGTTVVKELSSLTTGDVTVNATANKIRYFDGDWSSSGGFELANVKWLDDPLPVELTLFKATKADKGIKLEWQTATEINNYGFEIERASTPTSISGTVSTNNSLILSEVEGWEKIAFIEGHGNSNSPKDYSYIDESQLMGETIYRLKQIDTDGSFEYSGIVVANVTIQNSSTLCQNYPNPFNPITNIQYSLHESGTVNLIILNSLGQVTEELVNSYKDAGNYSVEFNAENYASGIYYYLLKSGSFVDVKKMLLIK